MTTLDKSKLKRILTQANQIDQVVSITGMLPEAQAIWNAAQAEQREEILRKVEDEKNKIS
jgi:hypothetical protein